MRNEKLQEIRQALDQLIENDADYEAILKVSVDLDHLIEDYMSRCQNQ
ncbi:MAG: Spo0E family sporulation regulatory protein-aspartic acid phosphatase [Vallitaleaceae bacterium]|nr:Spo0E family sporulation regulatory protein-aspartic acid phosphatase [Vallitaleaceae bacterium]